MFSLRHDIVGKALGYSDHRNYEKFRRLITCNNSPFIQILTINL